MRRQIRRWSKFPLDNFPRQIRNDQVLRLQFIIRNAARFNHHKTLPAIDPAGVSKSVKNQTSPHQFEIGSQDFPAKILKPHRETPSIKNAATTLMNLRTKERCDSECKRTRRVCYLAFPLSLNVTRGLPVVSGAIAVESRRTRLVRKTYSLPFGEGICL